MFWDRDTKLDGDDPRIQAPLEAIDRAATRIQEDIGTIAVDEDDITPRLAQAIEYEVNSLPQVEGTIWRVRIPSPTRKSEAAHGADLAVFVEIDFGDDAIGPSYKATKTALVQVKRADKLRRELSTLRVQSKKMRSAVGPDASAIVIAGSNGVVAADASDLTAGTSAGDLLAQTRSLDELFRAIFCCQAGTTKWSSERDAARDLNAMRLMKLEGRQVYRRR